MSVTIRDFGLQIGESVFGTTNGEARALILQNLCKQTTYLGNANVILIDAMSAEKHLHETNVRGGGGLCACVYARENNLFILTVISDPNDITLR